MATYYYYFMLRSFPETFEVIAVVTGRSFKRNLKYVTYRETCGPVKVSTEVEEKKAYETKDCHSENLLKSKRISTDPPLTQILLFASLFT